MALRYDKVSQALSETLVGKAEYTARQAAAEAEIDIEVAWHFWRALGFPRAAEDEVVFNRGDVGMLRTLRGLLAHEDADQEVLLQIARVSGQSFARMVAVQVLPISRDVIEAMRSREKTDTEATNVVVGRSEELLARVESFLGYAWRRHFLAAVSQTAATAALDLDQQVQTVGFADLVGFTATSQQLSDRAIARTVARFEDVAYEHILAGGGSVVKMIGDEVMFVASDVAGAVEIALGLVEAAAGDEIVPDLRIGLATGPTVAWCGDVYGPTVNLASRLVNVARPGTVLLCEASAERMSDVEGIQLRQLPRIRLKGIGKVRPRVARRATPS